ncbi:MAG: metallophosphoesterase [Bacteroidales bacterium]|nr:metallophosphoesterase [Bacteroidales bacterium]
MEVQYMSDLHLEFKHNRDFLDSIDREVTGDVLLLAGDIMYLQETIRHNILHWASRNYRQVLMVPGNHEYYNYSDITESGGSWQKEILPDVSYNYNKVVHIDDTDFILTTLWSRISQIDEKAIRRGLNDFHQICYDGEILRPKEYNEEHVKCFRFIRDAVTQSTAKHIVVVTHHAPSLQTIAPEHQTSTLRTAFASDLDEFIESSRIDYWVYGHSHTNIDCQVGNTIILCNQLGYVAREEHQDFDFTKHFSV